ncbi:MAG: hypothetical protein Q8K82_19075 [Gemmatimonadaceae bacterium]|nr:hypothetical protein [Gemmatimonadaceae bacterium]
MKRSSLLRREARELHAIDSKHLPADQALLVTDGEDRPEHVRPVLAQRAGELRDGGEMGRGVAAARDERHMLLAREADASTTEDALRVGERYHLQEHRRRIRRRAGRVVPEAGVEMGQVNRVVEQVMQRVLERAGQQLTRQIDGQEARVRIDVLVAGHGGTRRDGVRAAHSLQLPPAITRRVRFPHRVFRSFFYKLKLYRESLMLSFATELPIAARHTSHEFLCAIREWVLGSPHTQLVANDLAQLETQDESVSRKSNEVVESLRVSSTTEEAAAVRYTKNERGLEWVTTIVWSRQRENTWVGIRVSCESQHAAARLPTAKKPIVVRTLLKQLGGASDGALVVQAIPLRLENIDIDVAARCITGSAGCRLPVVYVSASFQGGEIVNVDSLAESLAGMAHVMVEPNRPFSLRLMTEVNSQNVYGGTIGVYWPDGGGRRSFFFGPEFDSAAEIEHAVFDEIRTALANRRPQMRCTWAAVQQAVSRRAFNSLKEQGSTQVDKYIEEFDKELKAKDEVRLDAEKEIARLEAEVRKYEARSPMGSGFGLRTGREQDLYEGELVEVVRDALADAVQRVRADSRRQHILAALVEANHASDGASARREKLKQVLRDYRRMDAKTKRGLRELGFEVTEDGKHYKLVFQGDDRYTFTLPKSGSDHRGGLNACSVISCLLF